MAADPFAAARDVLTRGLAARAFPAAVAHVGGRDGVRWEAAFGQLTYSLALGGLQTGLGPLQTYWILHLVSMSSTFGMITPSSPSIKIL